MAFPGLSDPGLASVPCSIAMDPQVFQRQHILLAQLINQDRKNVTQADLVSELPSSNSKTGGTANQSQQVEREPWNGNVC